MQQRPPLVVSSSAIAAYKNCPKAYDLGYRRGLIPPVHSTEAMEHGTSFHEYVAAAARGEFPSTKIIEGDPMLEVALHYLKHNPLPKNVITVEKPIYTQLLGRDYRDWSDAYPDVYLRTTFDLVYLDGNVIRARDYKTFEKQPSLDLDLDFQGRIYIAALMREFPRQSIEFEYEYVRRVPPGTNNSRGVWTPDTCYLRFPLVISKREADTLWSESQWVAYRMLEDTAYSQFWRSDRKGWNGCGSCFFRHLCKAELEHGELDDQMLAHLALPERREPLVLP